MMVKTPNSENFLQNITARLEHEVGDGKEIIEIAGDDVRLYGDFTYTAEGPPIPVYYNHRMKKSEILQAGVTKVGDGFNCFIHKSNAGNSHGIYSYMTTSLADVKKFEEVLSLLF